MVVTALSARALAQSARRAGYRPLVADLFGDLDTREAAEAYESVPGSLRHGLSRRGLLAALDRLAEGRTIEGIVWGQGFEDSPDLLHHLARRARLLGNTPETTARVKHPRLLAGLCRHAGVPHPAIRRRPATGPGWLLKRAGGAGGEHVRPARPGRPPGWRQYLQRTVDGRPVSALFLARGRECRVLGFSEQWTSPAPGRPFRYCGAARPSVLTGTQAAMLADAAARLVQETGLVGLNAADFLVTDEGFHLLEINPRPGATLDVFTWPDLFAWHVEASRGRLPTAVPDLPGARAAQVVYSRRSICLPAGFAWPDWASDRQPPGEPVPAQGPLCTVTADAGDLAQARALAGRRAAEILDRAEQAT